tara:strand:- start:310 stop:639 length:330 start_codon:yes stop_codon:yes gene_type:complete
MIKNWLKNICLISFALVGPITLPAGGIQRSLNEYKIINNTREIILTSNCPLYTFPRINAKQLQLMNSGSSLSVLRKWKVNERNIWLRVELASNGLIDNPNKIKRGWIKI